MTNNVLSVSKHYLLIFIAYISVGLLVSSCKEKIDIQAVDKTVQVRTGLAAPVATVKATMAEVLGINTESGNGQSSKVNWIFAKMPGETDDQLPGQIPTGTLYFRDTFDIMRDFHHIELSSYIMPAHEELTVKEQVEQILGYTIGASTEITVPTGTVLPLEFDIVLTLGDINNSETDERIDSMIIRNADFRAQLTTSFGLEEDEITSIELTLPEGFTHSGRQIEPLNLTPLNVHGEDVKVNLQNFEISLQDGSATPTTRREHMIDRLVFTLKLNINTTREHTFDENTTLTYDFFADLLDFEALFGYFNPSTYMEDRDTLVLAEEWSGWNSIKELKMRFLYPTIKLIAEHQVATEIDFPLNVNVEKIWVGSLDGSGNVINPVYAKFGEDGSSITTVWELYDNLRPTTSRIDPLKDPMNKWSRNEYVVGFTGYNANTHVGDVDKMFDVRPDIIAYDYYITVGATGSTAAKQAQCRLTHNTDINLRAITVVPFVCDEGSMIEYTDTADINLFSTDELENATTGQEWLDTLIDGNIYVYIYAQNGIPFELNAKYEFIDSIGNVVPLDLINDEKAAGTGYQMHIPAPTKYNAEYKATDYGENTLILKAEKDDINKLKGIRQLRYTVALENNPQKATIWTESFLNLQIGLSASIDAILDLNKINFSKEE